MLVLTMLQILSCAKIPRDLAASTATARCNHDKGKGPKALILSSLLAVRPRALFGISRRARSRRAGYTACTPRFSPYARA